MPTKCQWPIHAQPFFNNMNYTLTISHFISFHFSISVIMQRINQLSVLAVNGWLTWFAINSHVFYRPCIWRHRDYLSLSPYWYEVSFQLMTLQSERASSLMMFRPVRVMSSVTNIIWDSVHIMKSRHMHAWNIMNNLYNVMFDEPNFLP